MSSEMNTKQCSSLSLLAHGNETTPSCWAKELYILQPLFYLLLNCMPHCHCHRPPPPHLRPCPPALTKDFIWNASLFHFPRSLIKYFPHHLFFLFENPYRRQETVVCNWQLSVEKQQHCGIFCRFFNMSSESECVFLSKCNFTWYSWSLQVVPLFMFFLFFSFLFSFSFWGWFLLCAPHHRHGWGFSEMRWGRTQTFE